LHFFLKIIINRIFFFDNGSLPVSFANKF